MGRLDRIPVNCPAYAMRQAENAQLLVFTTKDGLDQKLTPWAINNNFQAREYFNKSLFLFLSFDPLIWMSMKVFGIGDMLRGNFRQCIVLSSEN